jgi:hypothetical protein
MIKTLSWLGTSTSILGSFLVANQFYLLGFSFFIVGSLSWLIVALSKNDRPLFVMNATFFVANLMGLYNAIN